MTDDRNRQSTGYPPVTATEERQAANNAAAARAGDESDRLGANEQIFADAVAAVMGKHRAEIEQTAPDPEAKAYALGLLDQVWLDILQTVLTETSAIETLRKARRVR